MANLPSTHPFDLLNDLERRCQARQQAEAAGADDGILIAGQLALRCGPWHLTMPMHDVAEIVPVPRYTRVPGVKPWLLGIASLRGAVVTIIDLNEFLRAEPTPPGASNRIVIVAADAWRYGLLVDEVIGMRRFDRQTPLPADAQPPPYVVGAQHDAEHDWLMFDIGALLADPKFLRVTQ